MFHWIHFEDSSHCEDLCPCLQERRPLGVHRTGYNIPRWLERHDSSSDGCPHRLLVSNGSMPLHWVVTGENRESCNVWSSAILNSPFETRDFSMKGPPSQLRRMLSGYEEFLGDEQFTRASRGWGLRTRQLQERLGSFGTW